MSGIAPAAVSAAMANAAIPHSVNRVLAAVVAFAAGTRINSAVTAPALIRMRMRRAVTTGRNITKIQNTAAVMEMDIPVIGVIVWIATV